MVLINGEGFGVEEITVRARHMQQIHYPSSSGFRLPQNQANADWRICRRKNWWDKREESEQAWKVSIEEIRANGYKLDIKNPKTVEDELGDPDELPAEYKMLLKEVAEIREVLKRKLMNALGGNDEWSCYFSGWRWKNKTGSAAWKRYGLVESKINVRIAG